MAVDPETASLLTEVAYAERRTREAVYYGGAAIFLILWGVVATVGNVIELIWPESMRSGWLIVDLAGLGATAAIFFLRRARASRQMSDARIIIAQFVLVAFGIMWTRLLSDHGVAQLDPHWDRQIGVFWTTLWMFGFVLAGLWVGRFFIYCGVVLTAVSVAAYLWADPWYPIVHTVVLAVALIGGGLWLRRLGVAR